MKKKSISEMTAAGSVAAVPMNMNAGAPIKRESAPAKPKKKKTWRNSLHETAVSEAELSEQDLILTPGIGRKLKPGLMRNQLPHEAREMAMGDLLQCMRNSKRILSMLDDDESANIEPWVQEKLVKASDYLNTVCEYIEGQITFKGDDVDPSVLTFEESISLTEKIIDDIDYSSGLGNLSLSDKQIIQSSTEDGTIGSRKVYLFKQGTHRIFFFVDGNKIAALIYLNNGRLQAMKRFGSNSSLIYNLFQYILNIKQEKIRLAPDDKLTLDGLKWILSQIKRLNGFKITDIKGNKIDPEALYNEWEQARISGNSGPTEIIISESVHGHRIRENEKSLMPFDIFGVKKQGVAEGTEYQEDTWVTVTTDKNGKKRYDKSKHSSEKDAREAAKIMRRESKPGETVDVELNPDIPGRTHIEERSVVESAQTRGISLLSALKQAHGVGSGYSLITESQNIELDHSDVATLLKNYRAALQTMPESTVLKMFGHSDNITQMLGETKQDPRVAKWSRELNAREHAKHNQLPDTVLKRIERNPELRADIIAAHEKKKKSPQTESMDPLAVLESFLDTQVNAALDDVLTPPAAVSEAAKNPYAIGMAAAKRAAGIKTVGKSVPKKVVTKAHEIAKAVKKDKK